MNSHDDSSGFSSLYQATTLLASPLHIPDSIPSPLFSEFDIILAKAREWMERHPGQKVKSDRLEGAFRQVNKHSWECLGCGETRKRREQIAHHIRGMHLDNRGFYHCDEPDWYAIMLHPLDYFRTCDDAFPPSNISLNTRGDLKRHKETHTGNRRHKCTFWQVLFQSPSLY